MERQPTGSVWTMDMHGPTTPTNPIFKATSPYSEDYAREIFLFNDPPHLIKCARNAWENKKRMLWVGLCRDWQTRGKVNVLFSETQTRQDQTPSQILWMSLWVLWKSKTGLIYSYPLVSCVSLSPLQMLTKDELDFCLNVNLSVKSARLKEQITLGKPVTKLPPAFKNIWKWMANVSSFMLVRMCFVWLQGKTFRLC